MLLILLITPLTFVAVQRSVGWRFVALSAIYLSNVTSLFGVDPQYVALWSLAVEEQFYLVWPAIVRFLSARALLGCILLVLVGSPVLRAVAFQSGQGEPGYTWLVGDGLALGALLSLLLRQTWSQRATALFFASACLAIGGIILAGGFHYGIVRGSTPIGATLRPTALNFLLAALMTAVLLIGSSSYHWLVNWKWLRFLGTISYGLYLIHMLVFDVVDALADKFLPAMDLHSSFGLLSLRFLAASALAITIAYLSRTYFEEWFLRLKNRV